MDQPKLSEEEAELWGSLSAFGFMIENLYALVMRLDGATPADARLTRDEMLRQMEDLPPVNEVAASEAHFLIQQHAINRLERLWHAIEARLAQ